MNAVCFKTIENEKEIKKSKSPFSMELLKDVDILI